MDRSIYLLAVCLALAVALVAGAEKAKCEIEANSGSAAIVGSVSFEKEGNMVKVEVDLRGFTGNVGDKHGFHVHQEGDLSQACVAALGHYNPTSKSHGAPTDAVRHVGDLGNIEEQAGGIIKTTIMDSVIQLEGNYSIIGRSIVVHANADDLGKGGVPASLTSGNAGPRMGCCKIVEDDDDDDNTSGVNSVTSNILAFMTSSLLGLFVVLM